MALYSDTPCIIHREGNKSYSNSGSIIYSFFIEQREIYSLGENDFDAIHETWYSALKDFDVGTIVHKMDVYLKKYFDASNMPQSTFLQKATAEHFSNRPFSWHYPLISFVFRESGIVINDGYKNPLKKPVRTKEFLKDFERTKSWEQQVERAVDFINSSRLFKLTPLSEEETTFLEFSYFNGFYEDRICDIDLKNSRIGNKHFGMFAISRLRQMPEEPRTCVQDSKMSVGDFEYYTGFADNLGLNLNFDHIYNQIIIIKNHKEEKQKIEVAKKQFFAARKFDSDFESTSKELGEFLDSCKEDEKLKLGAAHFNLIYFADSEREAQDIEKTVSNEFKNIDIMPYFPKGDNLKHLFLNSFFANVGNLDSSNIIQPIDIRSALCLFTNVTNYKNDDKGVYFNDRLNNIPVKVDVWDEKKKRIKARNFMIIAPTGEGKSVLSNHIFRQLYEEDYRIVIIDLGDSYQKLSYLFPNDTVYLKYKEGKGLGLNIFNTSDRENISSAKINEVSNFIFKLWKRNHLPSDDEIVSLRKVVSIYYKSVEEGHSFPQFYQFVEQNKNDLPKVLELKEEYFDVDDFLHITSEFVGKGIYAFLFEENVDESYKIEGKKFIVFELDEIKDNELLLSIMMHLIHESVEKVVWKDRTTKGIIFFDEFGKMLKFPSVLSSTEYFFQAARKQQAAIGVVLQTPNQLPKNDSAEAIITNTQLFYILQNTQGYKDSIERLHLSKHDVNQLGSIRTVLDGRLKYSEFLLKIGGALSNVYRLELPKLVDIAYKTDGADYTNVMKIYEEVGDMEEAIKRYSNQT